MQQNRIKIETRKKKNKRAHIITEKKIFMKREQRFKFINSAQPKVMYTSHAPTTYFTWYMQSKRVRAFMFCGRVFMIAIFVFLFHIRCIYDEIYMYTCWSLAFFFIEFTSSNEYGTMVSCCRYSTYSKGWKTRKENTTALCIQFSY